MWRLEIDRDMENVFNVRQLATRLRGARAFSCKPFKSCGLRAGGLHGSDWALHMPEVLNQAETCGILKGRVNILTSVFLRPVVNNY